MRPVLPLLLSLSLCAPALADWSGPIEQPLWSLPAAPGLSRWLIVHNLSSAAADGLYHVEVLERRQGQQRAEGGATEQGLVQAEPAPPPGAQVKLVDGQRCIQAIALAAWRGGPAPVGPWCWSPARWKTTRPFAWAARV